MLPYELPGGRPNVHLVRNSPQLEEMGVNSEVAIHRTCKDQCAGHGQKQKQKKTWSSPHQKIVTLTLCEIVSGVVYEINAEKVQRNAIK